MSRALAARLLCTEAALWRCLLRRLAGHRTPSESNTFRYDAAIRPLLYVLIVLIAVEGAMCELVLMLVAPDSVWRWLVLGLHLYAVVRLAGQLASLRAMPHEITDGYLILRDGVSNVVTISLNSIVRVQQTSRDAIRTGLVRSGAEATLSHGTATVAITLDPEQPVRLRYPDGEVSLRQIYTSADDPARFVRALRTALHDPLPA